MSAVEVGETQAIAHLRVHVERLIRRVIADEFLTLCNRGEVSLKLDIRRIFGHSFPMENYFLLNSFRVIGPRGPRPMLTSPTKWY
jgi:hypothetical protein